MKNPVYLIQFEFIKRNVDLCNKICLVENKLYHFVCYGPGFGETWESGNEGSDFDEKDGVQSYQCKEKQGKQICYYSGAISYQI